MREKMSEVSTHIFAACPFDSLYDLWRARIPSNVNTNSKNEGRIEHAYTHLRGIDYRRFRRDLRSAPESGAFS